MDAASAILHRQFPNIGGFMPVRFCRNANYSVPQEDTFIQFLHSPGHWIVVVKVFFRMQHNAFMIGIIKYIFLMYNITYIYNI